MSTIINDTIINDDELTSAVDAYKQKRIETIQRDLEFVLSKLNEKAKEAYSRGYTSFFIEFQHTHFFNRSRLRQNEPIFQEFKHDFLKNNQSIKDIKLGKLASYNGIHFYFSNPIRKPSIFKRISDPKRLISLMFARVSRMRSGSTIPALAAPSQKLDQKDRIEELKRKLTNASKAAKDPKYTLTSLSASIDDAINQFQETIDLVNSESKKTNISDNSLGLYFNNIETLTRALDAFLKISTPSQEDITTILSVIDTANAHSRNVVETLTNKHDLRARLELKVIAHVQQLNRPMAGPS